MKIVACPRLSRLRVRAARVLVLRSALVLAVLLGGVVVALALCFEGAQRAYGLYLAGMHWQAFAAGLFGLGAGLLAAVLAWCVFAPVPKPEGIVLKPASAPALHDLISRLVAGFGVQQLDEIRLTGDLNAVVVQRPRWGHLGPMQTSLLLGRPLLQRISERQLEAVLAHESAHLVLQRSGARAWGHHLRAWGFRAVDRLLTASPMLPRAVVDRFDELVVAAVRLARIEEYEADRAAARALGRERLAQALIELAELERRSAAEPTCHEVLHPELSSRLVALKLGTEIRREAA